MSSSRQEKVIEVLNFKKTYGSKVVHRDVSFEVLRGQCVGMIGGSGTGKSTILRCLIGLEKPDDGKILIHGTDIVPMNEDELSLVRTKVAYAFQGGALFDSMTVFENLAYPLREHTKLSRSEIRKRIFDQLKGFGLDGTEPLYPASLSGGMQKRVGLARAMMLGPEVVLYDEPTAGLDPYNTKKIQESILQLKSQGVTSILVTHDMPTAMAVCDTMIFLMDGKVAAHGTIEELEQNSGGLIGQFINGERA